MTVAPTSAARWPDPTRARLTAELTRTQQERDAAHLQVATLEEELLFTCELLRGARAHVADLVAIEVTELRAECDALRQETAVLLEELDSRGALDGRAAGQGTPSGGTRGKAAVHVAGAAPRS